MSDSSICMHVPFYNSICLFTCGFVIMTYGNDTTSESVWLKPFQWSSVMDGLSLYFFIILQFTASLSSLNVVIGFLNFALLLLINVFNMKIQVIDFKTFRSGMCILKFWIKHCAIFFSFQIFSVVNEI